MAVLTLSGSDAQLDVDPADGGRWTSLRVHGHELLTGAVVEGVPVGTVSGCFAMAPYAGRVRDAQLPFAGKVHRLPPAAGEHALHGVVFDVPWTVSRTGPDVQLQVPLGPAWPFRGEVRQELSLRAGGLRARLVLTAEEEQPAWIGWHPWFHRRLDGGEPVVVRFEPEQQYARGADGLPTGELVAPLPGPYDDCFRGVAQPVQLTWPGALRLDLRASTDIWVVFDERPDALCFEPQTAPPDAHSVGLAPVLAAGEELVCEFDLSWHLL